eukprot:523401_1
MMAKTFDSIGDAQKLKMRVVLFDISRMYNMNPAFIPPPLNVIVMVLLVIFYGIEYTINFINCCCRKKHSYNLAVTIMPNFIKGRKLELDDQILFDNCERTWTITTNRGPTKCKAVEYNKFLSKHTVEFYDITNGNDIDDDIISLDKILHEETKWNKIYVSVEGDMQQKHEWTVDLMHLYEVGLLDLGQFEEVQVDQFWANSVQDAVEKAKKEDTISPFWVCGYCRGFVKHSKVSIKQLGRLLNIKEEEIELINKGNPIICPNCYRVRFERKNRINFIWEGLSFWLFYILVFPLLFVLVGLLKLITVLFDPSELALLVSKCVCNCCERNNVSKKRKDGTSADDYYADTQLVTFLNSKKAQFAENDAVWEKIHQAKDMIDARSLRKRISEHIIFISHEDELTLLAFYDKYINSDSIKKNDDKLWEQYFMPLSKSIFNRIYEIRKDYLPLYLFARYPFDKNSMMIEIEEFFEVNESKYEKKTIEERTKEDVEKALEELKCFNCKNTEERQKILKQLDSRNKMEQNVDTEESTRKDKQKFLSKFEKYLDDVCGLFQNERKLHNMLRDTNKAILERGVDSHVTVDDIHWSFENLPGSTLGLAFFNAMRTESVEIEDKWVTIVQFWTIRNTLKSLYFLMNTTQKELIRTNRNKYISITDLLMMLFELEANNITDTDGTFK